MHASSSETQTNANNGDISQLKRGSKKRRKAPQLYNAPDSCKKNPEIKKTGSWMKLTHGTLWKKLREDSDNHYGCTFSMEGIDQFLEWSRARPIAILRRFCYLVGIQLMLRVHRFRRLYSID